MHKNKKWNLVVIVFEPDHIPCPWDMLSVEAIYGVGSFLRDH